MTVALAALAAEHLSKSYGANTVLRDVSFTLRRGEIHGLVGHNGAGKSTLLRILAGAVQPDSGTLWLDGQPVEWSGPQMALEKGVVAVYQELSLIEGLTVAENLFLGAEVTALGRLRRSAMVRTAAQLLDEYHIAADPTQRVGELSVAQKQMIEVVKAVHRRASYLLLDEPTTALQAWQVEQLLTLIRRLAREHQLGILLIDHKIDEVFAVADHLTALADGQVVLDVPISEARREDVVNAIVATSLGAGPQAGQTNGHSRTALIAGVSRGEEQPATPQRAQRALVLEVEHLGNQRLKDVSLRARAGYVLGLYGLVGAGRSRFLRCLYGLEPYTAERLTLLGKPYHPTSPVEAIRAGVAYLSEERKRDGFVPQLSPLMNAALPVLPLFSRLGLLRRDQLRRRVRTVLGRLGVRGSLEGPMAELSGGNQQKAILGRLILEAPALMLLDEPTKGVDIGAKREIYRIVRDLVAGSDLAVLVASNEEEEVLELCDEVVIFRRGCCDGTTYAIGELDVARLRELAWTGQVTEM
jgi:ABC-type sugar transport system ATPase subunit